MDGPGAQDDLVRVEALTAGRQHARGPVAVEQHPVHQRVAPDVEVGSGAGGLQVGVVGRDPPAVAGGEGDAADAGGSWRVVVVLDGMAEVGERGAQCVVERPEAVGRDAGQRDRPAAAVEPVAAVVEVVLDLEEPGEQLGPAPARATERTGPPVVVLGRAPQCDEPVDRRRPAHAAAAGVEAGGLADRAGGEQVGPEPAGLGQRGEEVQPPDGRRRVGARVVRPGLQQQDVAVRVLGQPGRQDSSGRSCADDHDVGPPLRAAHGHRRTLRQRGTALGGSGVGRQVRELGQQGLSRAARGGSRPPGSP